MSSLPALVRNSLVLLAGTAASKALVFVATLVLVRSLPAEGFGLYTLVFAWLSFFELFPDAGLDLLAVREAQAPGANRRRILGDALVARGLLILAAVPVAAALAPLAGDDPRLPVLVLLGALPWISSFRRSSLRSLLDLPWRVALRMEIPTLLGTLAEAAHLAILPLALGAAGVTGAVAALGLAHLPFAAVLAVLSFRRIRPEIRIAPGVAAATLRRTAPILALLLANTVLARIDVLMLEALRDSREVGLYAAPVRLVEVANLLPILLMTSVYPLFAEAGAGDPGRVDRLFRRSLRFLAAVIAPVIVAETVFAGPLVRLLFGTEYAGSAAVLPALAAAELLVFADIVMNARFVATGLQRRNLQLVAAAAAANVLANLVLIPAHGAAGAALATLAAYAVRVVAALGPRQTRAAGRSALAAILPAAGAGAAAWGVLAALGPRPAGILGAIVAYGAALAAFRGLRPGDLRQIRRALRGEER